MALIKLVPLEKHCATKSSIERSYAAPWLQKTAWRLLVSPDGGDNGQAVSFVYAADGLWACGDGTRVGDRVAVLEPENQKVDGI